MCVFSQSLGGVSGYDQLWPDRGSGCTLGLGKRRNLSPMPNILCSVSMIAMIGLGSTVGAHAQSLELSFGTQGRLAAGYTDQVPDADIFLFGDATARLSLNSIPLGFELGVFGLANAVDTPHETYGTVTWDFAQGGRLSLGVPRPAYDSFAVSAVDTLFPSLGVSHAGTTRSQATYGAMFEGFLPYGVRFENETDKLRFAASVDTVPNRDATIAGLGLALPIGDLTLESAVEVSWGTTTEVAAKVQLTGTAGGVNGGLGFYLPGTVGGPEVLEAFASFEPTEKISIAGVVQIPLSGSGDPTAGVSAHYAFSPAVGFSAGVLSDAGADAAYSALLDWTF
jgi:hypothetical protein